MPVRMNGQEAMEWAGKTTNIYAGTALKNLADMLKIDRNEAGWQERLAPFACVWAAMITASAADYDTAVKGGYVERVPD